MLKQIDIFDKNNRPTGKQAGIDYIMRKGLWHRGTHVTVFTRDGLVLIQKRSKRIVTHPGYLDFGSGGIVDAGEEPTQAAVRELHEEIGIKAKQEELKFTGIYRADHAFPRIRRFSRCFTYCYALEVRDEHVGQIQAEEVDWAKFVTLPEARRLVRKHRLHGLGMLIPHYGFYRQQLLAMEQLLKTKGLAQ